MTSRVSSYHLIRLPGRHRIEDKVGTEIETRRKRTATGRCRKVDKTITGGWGEDSVERERERKEENEWKERTSEV